MKKLLTSLLMMASVLSVMAPEAQAKRLGGGSSIGKQSNTVSRQASPPSPSPSPSQNQAANAAKPATPPAAPPAVPPKPASPWKGILGGALLGLGLGALLSHLGVGGALASTISTLLMVGLLVLAAVFIYRMFRRKSSTETQSSFAGNSGSVFTPEIGSRIEPVQPAALQSASPASNVENVNDPVDAPWSAPADFDKTGFLRHAKTNYIRLQAAWDRADVNDIREFTTPEMFAELRMQLQERGASSNHTDVLSLEADLLGIEKVGSDYLASVKFNGMIKEDENAPTAPFSEVWNLSKPQSGQSGWMLAGIQQLS